MRFRLIFFSLSFLITRDMHAASRLSARLRTSQGPGSGVPFHIHGPGWSETIIGRKLWRESSANLPPRASLLSARAPPPDRTCRH